MYWSLDDRVSFLEHGVNIIESMPWVSQWTGWAAGGGRGKDRCLENTAFHDVFQGGGL